jgi:uncharacterized protein
MTLYWSYTQDHALLALVIQEGKAAADRQKTFLGRTAVQKLIYFLHVLGVPMGYKFAIHHYGPFSDEIMSDMEWLLADAVVVDLAAESRYSNYGPGPKTDELFDRHKDFIEAVRRQTRTVCSALVPMKPQQLELLATLHYAYRVEKGRGGTGPWKSRVVDRFRSFKGEKFSETEIGPTFDRMAEIGLVEK